jgi:glycogen debranching enzyme
VVIEWRENSFEVCTEGRPGEARVVGSALVPRGHTSTNESLTIEYEVPVRSEGSVIPFLFAYSPGGIEAARGAYLRCGDADALLAASSAGYASLLSRSEMLTPDPLINRGIQWAKVNTARVQHAYRAGEAFTNDPPQDIVVVRDVAWYVFGSDYVTPEFSHNMLALAASHAFHPDGKLTEFIHADEEVPELHDYRLNINDDTPLCVIALYHHALICDESDALARAYPLMKRACDYILSQTEDGLVRCHSSGTNVWGICGWRNIIEGYNLTGAVTEINAECCRALECTAQAAAHLGKDEEARTYRAASERLRDAVNSKLVSEQTGLYLLSLTDDGTRRHDVTGDLVFPVLFGTADAPMRAKIVARLLRDDIWTPAGARTVSTKEKNYDPDLGLQLLGGVWPNLTAWIAFCCRRDAPARLVEGMRTIYACSEAANPASLVNLVPGEFPERLHGESFESRGMAMSPWMPPTYLWLGVEGLLGAELSAEGLTLNPSLPPGWSWVAVRNLPFRGAGVTAFLYHGELYSNHSVKSSFPLRIGTLIDTRADADSIMCIGLRVDGRILVFAASTRDARGTVSVNDGVRKLSVPVRLGAGDAKLLDVTDVQP